MDRITPLDWEALIKLGFEYNGNIWVHSHEQWFAIKLKPTRFYVCFHGYNIKLQHNLTVGELEEQYFKRTGKLLF